MLHTEAYLGYKFFFLVGSKKKGGGVYTPITTLDLHLGSLTTMHYAFVDVYFLFKIHPYLRQHIPFVS